MVLIHEDEGTRAADHAAALVEGRLKTEYIGTTRVISVRLPKDLSVQIQALATKSGKTRNATIATLLQVGIEEVRARLEPETIQELDEIEAEIQAHFFDN